MTEPTADELGWAAVRRHRLSVIHAGEGRWEIRAQGGRLHPEGVTFHSDPLEGSLDAAELLEARKLAEERQTDSALVGLLEAGYAPRKTLDGTWESVRPDGTIGPARATLRRSLRAAAGWEIREPLSPVRPSQLATLLEAGWYAAPEVVVEPEVGAVRKWRIHGPSGQRSAELYERQSAGFQAAARGEIR